METKIERLKGQFKIKLRLDKEEWEKEVDAAYAASSGKYKIQGFRTGKAPRGVIEKAYGEKVFFEEAGKRMLSREYVRVLRENPSIKPVDYPETSVSDNNLEYTLTVDVEPEFIVGKYSGLEVKGKPVEVTAKEVDDFIAQQVKIRSRQVAADNGHKIASGDIAVIDFVGSVDGVEFEGGKASGHELEIGTKSFIDNFEDQLVGKTVGERVNVSVTFPEKYHADNLAGKKALFVVDIKNILKRELPVVDDKFAKEASEFDNLADWKKDIERNLGEAAKKRADTDAKNELLKLIMDGTKIEIPAKMVDMKFAEIMEDMEAQLSKQGATIEMYAQYMNMPIEKIMETQRENAGRSVKARLVLDAIIKKEGIEVSDAEVKAKIDEITSKYDKKAAQQFKDPAQLEWLREDLRFEKLMAWLVKNNKIS